MTLILGFQIYIKLSLKIHIIYSIKKFIYPRRIRTKLPGKQNPLWRVICSDQAHYLVIVFFTFGQRIACFTCRSETMQRSAVCSLPSCRRSLCLGDCCQCPIDIAQSSQQSSESARPLEVTSCWAEAVNSPWSPIPLEVTLWAGDLHSPYSPPSRHLEVTPWAETVNSHRSPLNPWRWLPE